MESAARRLEFGPPPTPGLLRALFLAILAHGVLLAVLTAGVQWKHDPVQQTVEAELWSAVPVQAAPPAPEPEPEPEPKPKPAPVAPPEPKPAPAPTAAEVKAQADIAIAREKEKAKQLKDKQLALEKEKLAKEKLAKEKLEQDKQKLAKLEQDKKDKAKKDQADKLAADKDKQQRKQEQQAEAASAKARQEQMNRMARLAGGVAGGGNTPGGSAAAQSSGPSASYLGRLAARVKPNIVFSESVSGNPAVEVDVRTSPSGSILSARITKSSGIPAWDEAVLRAIEKTEILPRDTDGKIPALIPFVFRPKD
jgi:colicin import membrane protein